MTYGSDGALWFPENLGNKIARITAEGEFTEYDIPNAGTQPQALVFANDGSVWFTEKTGNSVGVFRRLSVD